MRLFNEKIRWLCFLAAFGMTALAVNPLLAAENSNAKTPAAQEVDDEITILEASPLPAAYEKQLFEWIEAQMTAQRMPFCWRESYGRGVGTVPLNCKRDGREKSGLICYDKCKAGYKGVGPVCWGICPKNMTDIGVGCQKSGSYMMTPYTVFVKGKCHRLNKARGYGDCKRLGLLWYQDCKKGMRRIALHCHAKCPSNFTDTSFHCTKPSYGRGVGYVGKCNVGEESDAGLCYKQCKPGFKGVGPVCWRSCSPDRPVNCGAACTTASSQCAKNVANMITAPVAAVAQTTALVLSLGSSAPVTAGAKAGRFATKFPKLFKAVKFLKSLKEMKGVAKAIKVINKIKPFAKLASKGNTARVKISKVVNGVQVGLEIQQFADDYLANFGKYTTKKINDMINKKLSPAAAKYVKTKYALSHLGIARGLNEFEIASLSLTAASIVDPTGILDVANAFTKPLCSTTPAFPSGRY